MTLKETMEYLKNYIELTEAMIEDDEEYGEEVWGIDVFCDNLKINLENHFKK